VEAREVRGGGGEPHPCPHHSLVGSSRSFRSCTTRRSLPLSSHPTNCHQVQLDPSPHLAQPITFLLLHAAGLSHPHPWATTTSQSSPPPHRTGIFLRPPRSTFAPPPRTFFNQDHLLPTHLTFSPLPIMTGKLQPSSRSPMPSWSSAFKGGWQNRRIPCFSFDFAMIATWLKYHRPYCSCRETC